MRFPGSIPIEYLDAFGAGIYLLFGIMHADLMNTPVLCLVCLYP